MPDLWFVVTEDWYFWSHRRALARAARDAGYRVTVACRVQAHGAAILAEGFGLVPLPWRRGGGSWLAEAATLWRLWRALRRARPDLVHAIALKGIVYGGLAARLARVRARVATVAGLGYVFTSPHRRARWLRAPLLLALRLALARAHVIVQNPDDGLALVSAGVLSPARLRLVRGSGVDLDQFAPGPSPAGIPVVTTVCRMVRDKGVPTLVDAARILRAAGVAVRVRLVGAIDPENRDALTPDELRAWVREGIVEWDGPSHDIPAVWRTSHIAAYASTYGEGIPKCLIEAAACGLPIVTTDRPGCRETVVAGESGLLVPGDDPTALAAALRRLIEDPGLRQRFGAAARAKAEAEFGDQRIIAETLAVYAEALEPDALRSSRPEG